jgi:hypothetical protein
MAKHAYQIGPVEAVARTKTEARQMAEQNAGEMLEQYALGSTYIYYRDDVWAVRYSGGVWLAEHVVDFGRPRRPPMSVVCRSAVEAHRFVMRSQAMGAWTPALELDLPNDFPTMHPEDLSEYISWAKFQVRFRCAIDAGMQALDAHHFAGKDPGRTDVWHNSNIFVPAGCE